MAPNCSNRPGSSIIEPIQMPKFNLLNVRTLPIKKIAQLWAAEAELDREVLEQELRISVLTFERLGGAVAYLSKVPPKEEWPDAETLLDRDHLRWFCLKERHYPLPEFWFGPQLREKRKPGRPPLNMGAIVQEFHRRRQAGNIVDTLADEARALRIWFAEAHPDQKLPAVGTIENEIRELYNAP